MGIYFFLRYAIVAIAFAAWIFYQKKIKNKPWAELRNDIIVILLFIVIASGLYYWLFN